MSLMDTFVQVFEFDTRQAAQAFDKVQRSTDDIIEGMKKTQEAAEQSSLTFGSVMNELWQSLQGLSGEHTIDFSTNAEEVSAQTDAVKSQLDSVSTALVALDEQREATDVGWSETQSTLGKLDEHYQLLHGDIAQLSTGMTELENTESQSVATKRLANAIIQALQGNYKELIRIVDEMRAKGIEAANSEVKAQSEVQKALDNTDAKYQKTGNTVVSFAKKALGAVGLLMGATAMVSESVTRSAEIESLDKLGKKINVAAADVDAFAGSMAELGGARDAAQADLSAMAKSFGFAKNSMEKVLKTADKVQGMKFDKAKATLSVLGVTDDKTVELMMKGRKELERMMGIQKEYSGINKESIEQSIKFNKAMQGFKQSSGLLKNSFLEMVIPVLTKGLEWINKFVGFCKDNKQLMIGFFIAIGSAVAIFYVPSMIAAATATLAATWPILAIVAIIALLAAAFAFVYDDIMNFIDGNDSMIGRILDEYPELKEVILRLWQTFKILFEYLMVAVKFVADVVVDAYNTMNNALNQFIDWLVLSINAIVSWGNDFKGVFNTVSDAVVGIFKWLWAQIQQYLGWINDGLDAIKNGWSTVKGWFGFEDAEVTQTVERKVSADGAIEHTIPETSKLSEEDTALLVKGLNQQITGMSTNPMNPVTSQAISNQSSTTNETNLSIGELKVETQSTDAQGMASGAKDALQSQLQDLGHQNSTGWGK
ncbi:TPA: hypothetical protein ACS78B_000139 [Providencia alcalifaciens]|uniref:hypothetical protein n=1 Tax=Providencia alcalifaciens TaxID=126385 RepID=UPI00044ED18F|nr:hypothetical protein HMPREF1562_0525 [Providencia alcalifaciens F90-2004]CAG9424357.1 hypothetical protein NVI2019_NGLDDFDA_02371 [Providencia alcalifaciens]